ncbi:type IV pilus twitching motility protein PilT [Alkalibacter mobilis]|uniref:type IV pilus twitching motility protein PilT n=1 Tax=Alkalibacter mobilis TaxID=2787712 RepID=UPI0018A085A0|nr:type IV pilus twitching motility protein PilT [Alkalibacter mobilis]MBF7095763.1 type IV pilus twitching motility protein PilT [Alkalibacter mobilis]
MKSDIYEMLKTTTECKASDLHITAGLPPMVRIDGSLKPLVNEEPYTPDETESLIFSIMDDQQIKVLQDKGQVDYSYSLPGFGRFRVNAFRQRNSYSMACRVVGSKIPTLEELNLPETLAELTRLNKGLILVTGPTGSGKSTTLASMIDIINQERKCHILTLEDPIEYLHKHKSSMVNQREVGHDTNNYSEALRAALREDPDVILVGEMRDLDSISIALTAAETGHLVLSTLHTVGSAKTIDRVIDVFPPHQQQQIKVQLSTVLQAVISQQLISKKNQSGRIVALEVMVANPAIRNLIREGKTHQVNSIIQMSGKLGMVTMDNYLFDLYSKGLISMDNALFYCLDQENMRKRFI